jgi:hypothetical protein
MGCNATTPWPMPILCMELDCEDKEWDQNGSTNILELYYIYIDAKLKFLFSWENPPNSKKIDCLITFFLKTLVSL